MSSKEVARGTLAREGDLQCPSFMCHCGNGQWPSSQADMEDTISDFGMEMTGLRLKTTDFDADLIKEQKSQ